MKFGLDFSSKSATFICTVTIHELAQVPLVNAQFRLKWKFKQACTGILEEVEESTATRKFLNPLSTLGKSYEHSRQDSDDSTHYNPNDYSHLSPPTSPSQDPRTPNPDRTPSQIPFSGFTSPFGTPINSPVTTHDFPYSPRTSTADEFGGKLRNRSNGISLSEPILAAGALRAEPKGTTTLVGLRNYTATFQREVHCSVSIPVRPSPSNSRYQLQPSPLRLAIRQEITEEGGKKVEVKTGEVMLDLSQFVDQKGRDGKGITRRYLLRDCKTNATLRVNVKMEWVAGEKDYALTPLKSGQIEGQIATSVASPPTTRPGSTQPRKSSSNSVSQSGITRSNSSSSLSQRSSPSTKSVDSPHSKRTGWRPPSSTTSQAPSLYQNANPNPEKSALDIVDSIFNRTAVNKSLFGFTPAPTMSQKENGRTRISNYAGRQRAMTTPTLVVPPLAPPHAAYERLSVDGRTSVDGRRSVKWGDDETASASLKGRVTTGIRTGVIRPSSSSQSLGGLARVEENNSSHAKPTETSGGIQWGNSWS